MSQDINGDADKPAFNFNNRNYNFKQTLHITHLSLFLFFDVDLSPEKSCLSITKISFLLLIKNTQIMQ